MLDPGQRHTLIEALKPPPFHRLDEAICTTYTLDLLTLLTAPLAFTLFEDDPSRTEPDPLAILNAMRTYASRITLFCQAGRIRVPDQQRSLFLHLEDSVCEVRAPIEGGLFHPKLWVLKYGRDGFPSIYRLLCSSRNLTFDKSWDTLLVLDGEAQDRLPMESRNRSLADFVRKLPDLSVRSARTDVHDRITRMADGIECARFEPPDNVDDIRFWPMGVGPTPRPFDTRVDRLMIISPFVSPAQLRELPGRNNILVSRHEELSTHDLTNAGLGHIYALSHAAEPEPADDMANREEESGNLYGLHAKLYVGDAGWDANVWTGSANATTNAFHRNVEFLVQLSGRKSKLGIDAVLGDAPDKGLRRLLEPFRPTEPVTDADNEDERRLDEARLALVAAGFHLFARADMSIEGTYALDVFQDNTSGLPEGVHVRCWPVTLPKSRQVSVDTASRTPGAVAAFRGLSAYNLTSFLAFEVRSGDRHASFVTNLPIEGAPDDRHEQVLGELLKDKDSVLRFILLLLSDPEDPASEAHELLKALSSGGNRDDRLAMSHIPLLETMLRSLHRDPARLDSVDRLIKDLMRTGHDVLPDGLSKVWAAIWAARRSSPR